MEKYIPGTTRLVMSRREVRAVDDWAINTLGIPGVILMENAGRSCTDLIVSRLTEIGGVNVCIFCGTGNNGGDGYVIARHLTNRGFHPCVVICGQPGKIKGDAKINLDILKAMGLHIEKLDLNDKDLPAKIKSLSAGHDFIVDSLFGTGLSGLLQKEYITLVESINTLGKPILAVDIPSGLDCDSGLPLPSAIRAEATVTFVAVKKGFMTDHARQYTGDVYIASIGIEPK
ncbi:MAG: NAD(P)H-hydrate epimerase [Planctomycetota bacterium]